MSIVDRLMEIKNDIGASNREFDLSLGKSSGYLATLKRTGGLPGVDVIAKVLDMYGKYSPYWLILNKGDKFNFNEIGVAEKSTDYKILQTDVLSVFRRESLNEFKTINQKLDVLLDSKNT